MTFIYLFIYEGYFYQYRILSCKSFDFVKGFSLNQINFNHISLVRRLCYPNLKLFTLLLKY